jgi:multisubunit Na+/H+ antiporter MnhB subunit
MLLKTIAFLTAILPLLLFARSFLAKRASRLREGVKEFKKHLDVAIWIFLGLVGCLVTFAAGKLIWTWWGSL